MSVMAIQLKLPQVTTSAISTAHIFDAMALVHMTNSFGTSTFSEMALKYYQIITVPFALNGCHRVDVVFNQYFSLSIKAGEREKRGASMALEVQIRGPSTPVPKQWLNYIEQIIQNKVNLSTFLADSWCELAVKPRLMATILPLLRHQ